jgi:hypothetical protein
MCYTPRRWNEGVMVSTFSRDQEGSGLSTTVDTAVDYRVG